jgi:hypothetical protein
MIFAYGAGRSRVVWSRSSCRLGCSPHTTPSDKTAWCPPTLTCLSSASTGPFTLDQQELAARGPRNPKRVVFEKMERFSLFDDLQGTQPIAKDCVYAHRGPRPRVCTYEAAIPMQRRGFLQASHGPLGFVRSGPGHSKASATAA